MTKEQNFQGFSKKTVQYFNNLKKNNNREWFHSHRKDYDTNVMEPSSAFVFAMGTRLKALSPNIMVIPKVNRSLFRISRDTRFSADKSPYKTNMGIFFWEGSRPRMECSGFYFHLEPPKLMLGVGIYMFPKQAFGRYRKAVVAPESGEELSAIIKKISKLEGYELGGKHYKRVPSGFDSSHSNAELLLYNGLYAGITTDIPDELYSTRIIDYCWKRFKPLVPLHQWLLSIRIGHF